MATIALDDVVLEQMETNVLMSSLVAESRAMYFMERSSFQQLIEKQDELIDTITAQIKNESRRDREDAREGGGEGGDGGGDSDGGGEKSSPFKKSFRETAGAGMGSAVGMAASLTALGAGIAGFIGALTVAGGITKLLGIDFSGMKKMLVGVAGAFAAASTAGLIKFMIFMGAANTFLKGGNWAETAKNLGGLGLGISGFILALGAAGGISSLFGLDYSGLKNMLEGVSEAFAAVDPIGFAIMAGVVKLLDMSGMSFKTMASIGAGLAALITPLAVVGAASGAIGGGKGLKDLLGGLGDGMAALGMGNLLILTALGATLMILGGGTPLTGVLAFGAIGLGLAALITPLAAAGAASAAMGGGKGLEDLLTGLGMGLRAIGGVDFIGMLPAGIALTGLAAGLVALTGGQLIASIGEFITKFFRGEDKTVIQRLAEDLSNFNKVDMSNLAKINDAADGIDKMAEAMDKLKDVDGEGLFAKLSGALKDFALSNPLTAPVRMVMGETPSDFTPSPAETYEAVAQPQVATAPRPTPEPRPVLVVEPTTKRTRRRRVDPQEQRDMQVAELGVTFRNAEEARKSFEASDASFETFVDPNDFFEDEQRQYTDPAMQAEYEALLQAERNAKRAYRRSRGDLVADGDRNVETYHKVEFLQERGLLPQNFNRTFRMGELDRMIDEYFEDLQGSETKPELVSVSPELKPKSKSLSMESAGTRRVERPMVDTMVTDYVEKEGVASATAQSAAPVVIQDNSVNMPSQTSVNQNNIQQPPMSSPIKDNGTRVAAAYG